MSPTNSQSRSTWPNLLSILEYAAMIGYAIFNVASQSGISTDVRRRIIPDRAARSRGIGTRRVRVSRRLVTNSLEPLATEPSFHFKSSNAVELFPCRTDRNNAAT